MKLFLIVALTAVLAACGEMQSQSYFETQKTLQSVDDGVPVDSRRPSCEVDFADYQMNLKLMAFQITSKNNLEFGIDLLKGIVKALGLKLKTEKGRMVMAMDFRPTLNPAEPVADVMGEGSSRGVDFRIELDAIRLGADFGYYYQTPIYKLTEKTLKASFKNLTKELSKVEADWRTKIVSLPEWNMAIIPVGTVGGIEVGDTFNIFNVEYNWMGEPCQSALFERKAPVNPIAMGRVVQRLEYGALLELSGMSDEYPVVEGARVEVRELIKVRGNRKRQLKRAVRLGRVEAEKVPVEGAQGIDLSMYFAEQVTALLSEYGFYERK